jgi:hypothetical protein
VAQEEVLDQLLGQRAAALGQLPLAQVDPGGPCHAAQRQTLVAEERGVLGRQHRPHQRLGQILGRHRPPLTTVGTVEGGQQRRLQQHLVGFAAAPDQPVDAIAAKADLQGTAVVAPPGCREAPQVGLHPAAGRAELAGPQHARAALAVAEKPELLH